MKITYINGETVDTDKMDDLTAQVAEKVEEFYQFCAKYNLPMICRVGTDKGWRGSQNFGGNPHFTYEILMDLNRWLYTGFNGHAKLALSTEMLDTMEKIRLEILESKQNEQENKSSES